MKKIGEIGKGGFGVVDEIENYDHKRYARKTYCVNQSFTMTADIDKHLRKRFEREAKLQSGLSHKNIVPILEKHLAENPPYFLMPLADSTLERDIQKNRNLDGKFVGALMDIVSALEELHSVKIYHRDLKPGNVLRFTDPTTNEPYYAISDFGLIALKQTQVSMLTQVGMKMSSDFYTAPEITQDLSAASAQSDIFSLGCILHDFVGQDSRVPCSEIHEKGDFSGILLNCTRKDPKRRFKSVSAVRDAVLAVLDSHTIAATPGGGAVIALLDSSDTLSEEQWQQVIDVIDQDPSSGDAQLALRRVSAERIDELFGSWPNLGEKLGHLYAEMVREKAFDFSDCDAIAYRLERFMYSGDMNLQAECLMALLYMGTSHNRWYVERKFYNHVGPSMNEDLAKRISIEFRADDEKVCRAISHLESSISATRDNVHPVLKATLKDVCK